MPDRHIRRGPDDYAHALAGLLPRGLAWPREPETLIMRVTAGLAAVWGYVDGRIADWLERETDPRLTVELLLDWEGNWGLPDACLAEPQTMEDRRRMLVQRMTIEGGQSREFFISVAAGLGYLITITEFRPFMVGLDRAGDNRTYVSPGVLGEWPAQIGPPEMRFYWRINVINARLSWFRAASGQAGVDPHLRIGLATDLECLIRRWKPGHTDVIFSYTNLAYGSDPMAGTP
jgi:uncharacterized protein YmfQ (DUF2313 family)